MLQQLQQQQQANLPPGIRLNESAAYMDNGDAEDLDQDENFDEVNSIDDNLDLTNGDYDEDALDDETQYADEDQQIEEYIDNQQNHQEINGENSYEDDTMEDELIDENEFNQQIEQHQTAIQHLQPKSHNRRKNRKSHHSFISQQQPEESDIKDFENNFEEDLEQSDSPQLHMTNNSHSDDELEDEELTGNGLNHQDYNQGQEIISNMT